MDLATYCTRARNGEKDEDQVTVCILLIAC